MSGAMGQRGHSSGGLRCPTAERRGRGAPAPPVSPLFRLPIPPPVPIPRPIFPPHSFIHSFLHSSIPSLRPAPPLAPLPSDWLRREQINAAPAPDAREVAAHARCEYRAQAGGGTGRDWDGGRGGEHTRHRRLGGLPRVAPVSWGWGGLPCVHACLGGAAPCVSRVPGGPAPPPPPSSLGLARGPAPHLRCPTHPWGVP